MLHRDIKKREVFYNCSTEFLDKYFNYMRYKVVNYIDTFYYTVTTLDDTSRTNETAWYQFLVDELKRLSGYDEVEFLQSGLFVGRLCVPHFQLHLYLPDCFDVFIAESTQTNDTPFMQVQLRSSYLWLHGVKKSIVDSKELLCDLLKKIGCDLNSLSFKENRIDYCYHTNFIESPFKFFTPENVAKLQCSHFKESFAHIEYYDEYKFDIDFYSFGKRNSPVYLRFYLKSKEVVEKGKHNKKCFFIEIWRQREMISEFDAYCLTYAYERSNWNELHCGRLQFVLDYVPELQRYQEEIVNLLQAEKKDYDAIRKLADRLVPDVHSIINCEFQCNRKFFSSCVLFDLSNDRLLNVYSNTDLICDFLTQHTFKFVDYNKNGKVRKTRCDVIPFWKEIQSCKFAERLEDVDYELVRDYSTKTNFAMMKRRAITAINSVSLCVGQCENNLLEDVELIASIFNDNDIEDARHNKNKRMSKVSYLEEFKSELDSVKYLLKLIDRDTGEII